MLLIGHWLAITVAVVAPGNGIFAVAKRSSQILLIFLTLTESHIPL